MHSKEIKESNEGVAIFWFWIENLKIIIWKKSFGNMQEEREEWLSQVKYYNSQIVSIEMGVNESFSFIKRIKLKEEKIKQFLVILNR